LLFVWFAKYIRKLRLTNVSVSYSFVVLKQLEPTGEVELVTEQLKLELVMFCNITTYY
jgi:hypothetical protein